MNDQWLPATRAWAETNGNVKELWLFGSRAKGTSRPDSDADIAVVLMPAHKSDNWALGNYVALHSHWKKQLEEIIGYDVHLNLLESGSALEVEVRETGELIWTHA